MKTTHLLSPPLVAIFLIFTLCSSFAGCSTVYDNTVGLVYGDEESTESISEVDSQDSESLETVSNTSDRVSEETEENTAKVAIEGTPPSTATDEVEVLWKIPDDPVEGFVLKYGFDRESLSKEVSLNLSQIEKYDDPEFGFVYRYVLKNVPTSKTVFVRLATKAKGKITPFSDIFEVAAE